MTKRFGQCIGSVDLRGRPYLAGYGTMGPQVRCKRKGLGGPYCRRCTEAYAGDRGTDFEDHIDGCNYVHGAGPCDCDL